MFDFSDINDFKGNTRATIKASLIGAIDSFHSNERTKLSKNKLLAFSKLVGTLEKKIMMKKIDFWLPLRVHCASNVNKSLGASRSSGNEYSQPTVLKL